MESNRSILCQYSADRADDSGIESLKIFCPTDGGYINYNVVHSLSEVSKCDTWRLSVAYYCDGALNRVRALTRSGAEWEMALKISGRPDFIGGYAHGDEVFDALDIKIDGKICGLNDLQELTAAKYITVEVASRGYDPNDSTSEAHIHQKKICFDISGVRVEQRVEWLNGYELGRSYMAMMPPIKDVTDHYFTDKDPAKIPIKLAEDASGCGVDAICLCGESGFIFEMRVEKYLSDVEKGNSFLVTDNGGVPYNKMYFVLCHGGSVSKGDVWESVTVYEISKEAAIRI